MSNEIIYFEMEELSNIQFENNINIDVEIEEPQDDLDTSFTNNEDSEIRSIIGDY